MAAYPSLPITYNSKPQIESGRTNLRASNGALKVRQLYSSERFRFALEHELTAAQVSTLDGFYTTNRDLDVDFTWAGDGVTRTVRFVSKPLHVPQHGGWFKTSVELAQV